ncbi:hypothetical protein KAI46_03250 [bacterium]|nr:hypothetical protein [bacterium]
MAFTLNSITLPAGLHWADKYDWTPVSQETEVLLHGTLNIEEAAQLAGRPITLVGGINHCWCPRSTIDTLYALLQAAGSELTLDLDSDGTHDVIWRRDSQPLVVEPVITYSDNIATTLYAVKQLCFFKI